MWYSDSVSIRDTGEAEEDYSMKGKRTIMNRSGPQGIHQGQGRAAGCLLALCAPLHSRKEARWLMNLDDDGG